MTLRRSPYEIVIDTAARPHVRHRISVTALFAPNYLSAAELLLDQMEKDDA